MNPIDGMLEYFKVLGTAVDTINRTVDVANKNVTEIAGMLNQIALVGGACFLVMLIVILWQGAVIREMKMKVGRIEELANRIESVMIRRVYDERRNGE